LVPDGRVILTGLLPKRKAIRVLGASGKTAEGVRVARMAKGGRSTNKTFQPGGGEPVLFREMLEQGAVPLNIVQFAGEPGTPFQEFRNEAEYQAALAGTPVKARSTVTAGGDNQFNAGGAATTSAEGETVNLDAAQSAEARASSSRTSTTRTWWWTTTPDSSTSSTQCSTSMRRRRG
jgi:hypothetical protein